MDESNFKITNSNCYPAELFQSEPLEMEALNWSFGGDEVIRLIQVRCRFDEEADDYLRESDEGFIDLCPKCRAELEKT